MNIMNVIVLMNLHVIYLFIPSLPWLSYKQRLSYKKY